MPLKKHLSLYRFNICIEAYDVINSYMLLLFEVTYDPLSMFEYFLDEGHIED